MIAFEKIMEIFKIQFEIDTDIEVAKFRRGYQIFIWDNTQEVYLSSTDLINTTDELFNELIDKTKTFYEIRYMNPKTETIDATKKYEINKIIDDLKTKYSDIENEQ